ncbi:MAG TPA: nicotinate phosphoribosyltransferase [Gammaproteobacteria bacterium]|nr:nicotinate phosphoribosyltransferase [Gammaproteobacteria bacterium]
MNPLTSVLLTDLYQLTMLAGYLDRHMEATAVFELFVRKLPDCRNFLLVAGLEQALAFLERLRFTPEELDWIKHSGRFKPAFIDYLAALEFTGDVEAMPEGTVFFANEPVLRVMAPLPQAQLIETRLINLIHFQTLIASKAARLVLTAPGKLLVDFGLRRAHGAEAGLLAARAGYIAGMAGTATALAAPLFDIPIAGTMAHAFIQAHDEELAAFEHFARAQPDNVVLLIDTYDTEAAASKVVELAGHLAEEGIPIKGVRIDSGDLAEHARKVRKILDDGGHPEITIFASGNLDEYALAELVKKEAPIDGFGIGTHLDTSADRPYLDYVYKLQEYAGIARRKRSEGKATWPGRKQVYRYRDGQGRLAYDLLTLEADPHPGEPLIKPVMRAGKRLASPEPLSQIRNRVAEGLASLPERLRGLEQATPPYEVRVSEAIQRLAAQVDAGPS